MYIYIHVIRNTHLHTGWRRKTNDISWCIIESKANVDHHTYILSTNISSYSFLLIERQKIILSEDKFDYLIALVYMRIEIIEKEWHLTDVFNTNKVLFDILLNVNRCRRCFHKFTSNMTRMIFLFVFYISLYSSYTTHESTV